MLAYNTPGGYYWFMETDLKKKAIRRLKIATGQIKGLEKMVAGDKYCIDVINQSLAIKKALSSFEDLMLENHLKTHAMHQIKHGKSSQATKEILAVYKLSKKK